MLLNPIRLTILAMRSKLIYVNSRKKKSLRQVWFRKTNWVCLYSRNKSSKIGIKT